MTDLPLPTVSLTPERGALPRAGGRVDALLRIEVGVPGVERDREAVTLALVIDRSGSMGGEPLAYAKRAAQQALTVLQPGDAVAVVAFDSHVGVVVPTVVVHDDLSAVHDAIEHIGVGGSTALHGGWVEGLTQGLALEHAPGMARVVLLSDGRANVGETRPVEIAADVAKAFTDHGVSTSAVGLGAHFDERLMSAISTAGGGTFTFVETPHQLPELFETEIASLSSLRGRRVRLAFDGAAARFVAAGGGARLEAGRIGFPDLVGGMPRDVLVTIELDAHSALPPLRLSWDDTYTGAHETLDVTLDLQLLDPDELAARAVDPAVAAAQRKHAYADAVGRIEPLVRGGRFDDAEQAITSLRAQVDSWPADASRDESLRDLAQLLERSRARDHAMSAKVAHRMKYHLDMDVGSSKRASMLDVERGLRSAKQAYRQAASSTARPARATDASAGRTPTHPARTVHQAEVAHQAGGTTRLEVVIGDITQQTADAIVNPSNRGLFGTAGVDGAVHAMGGPELTAACRAIGGIDYGQATVTPGFRLAATHVIHTTTPRWRGGNAGELATLERAYAACLDAARRLRVHTLAIPAIGTGAFRYPLDQATEVAVAAVIAAVMKHEVPEVVRFVVLDGGLANTYARALDAALVAA